MVERGKQESPAHAPGAHIGLASRRQPDRELEELWRAAFESNPTMYFIVDDGGIIVSVNSFGAQQLGHSVAELIGRPVLDVFFEPDRALVRQNAESCLRNPGRGCRWEARKIRKDGSMLWVRETANAVVLPSRRTVLLVACEDVTERKRAEEALRQREKELRDIFETVPAMAFAADADGGNVLGNRRWLEYAGPGSHAASSPGAVHADDVARYKAARLHSIATGEPFEQEVRLRRFDGEYRWFLSRAVPLRDEKGSILKWYGAHTDIHDRKLAAQERAAHVWFLESMDRINRAMQGTNDLEAVMSGVLDAVLEVFACDRAWLIYPCDPEAPSWRAVMEHARPQFPGAFALGRDMPLTPQMVSSFRAALEAGGAVLAGPGHELQVPESTTQRYAVRSRMTMAVRPKVDRPYLFGVHQCSHARVWSEQEKRLFEEIGRRLDDVLTSLLMFRSLRESERKLEEAQRIGRMGYFEYHLGSQRLTLSDEACRIYGLEQHELASWQGRTLELVHPDDRAKLAEAIAATAEGDGRFEVEFRALRPDGDIRIVHSRGEATRDGSGLRAFGTLQDLTELRRAQEDLGASAEALYEAEAALARVNRVTTLGVLAASIAHEVNQPLGAITASAASCARWLAAQPPRMDRAAAALDRIAADGKRAAQVVDRIRALVNRQAPRKGRLDLNEAILEVIALTNNEMRRKAIALETSLAADVPPIEGDRVQLQQVVLNLAVNAIEAMEEHGELAIASARDGVDGVLVEVRDSGPGVDPAQVDRLFDAFYTSKADGIGMGLSISRAIIEAHGGRLWFTPNLPRGAAFRIWLPAEPSVA